MSTTKTGHRTIGGQLAAMVAGAMAVAHLSLASAAMAQGGQIIGWGFNASGQAGGAEPSLLRFTRVDVGSSFTYAIRADGSVTGWGRNDQGQLSTPADLRDVAQIACGSSFTFARRTDGTLVGWGAPDSGVLNPPAGLGPVASIACGGTHAYAVRHDRTAVGWGLNDDGQVSTPTAIQGLVSSIDCGGSNSYAVLVDGTIRGWGRNDFGQTSTPNGLAGVTQVACGSTHTYALLSNGTLMSWGYNGQGQRNTPALSNVTQVACGYAHTYALRADGTVVGWGSNTEGQRSTPPGLHGVREVVARGDFTYALTDEGNVVGWGSNDHGERDTPSIRPQLVQIACGGSVTLGLKADGTVIGFGNDYWGQRQIPAGLTGVIQVACGDSFAYALTADRSLVGWGNNSTQGELNTPSGTIGRTVQVACGRRHTYALRLDGTLVGWGSNSDGQRPPAPPASATNIVQVSCGSIHTYAVRADGTVVGWGSGGNGQTTTPTGLSGVLQVACGGAHTYARRQDGTLVGWGSNNHGQRNTPSGATGVIQVAAGQVHTVALKDDGTVLAWGDISSSAPTGLTGVTQIATGPTSLHSVALLSSTRSSCTNPSGAGTVTVKVSGSSWQQVGVWEWSNGGTIQTPGALTNVTLGEYGSVGSLCDARCATLEVPGGSTLLVPVDLTQPLSSQDHSIDVGGLARLQGRVWLLASGATTLPANFSVPVVNAGSFDGLFSIIQSTLPAPAGKFLTLVPSSSLGGGTTWSLALRDLPGAFGSGTGGSAEFNGVAVAAEAMDLDGDGFDDLALVIDNGPSQPGHLQVILNDGSGNLGNADTAYRVDTAPRPVALAVGDLDGDGDDDAAVATASNLSARVYLNTLADGFSLGGQPLVPSTVLAVGAVPTCVAVVPAPQPRVAVGSAAANSVAVFEPTASEALQVVTVPVAPAAMGRRGRIILSGGANPSSIDGLLPSALGRLVVLTPGGDGAYALTQSVDVPGKPRNLDVADIDRDGIEDAITANLDPQQVATGTPLAVLTLFRGTATGVGQAVPIAPQGATAGGDVAMVDVNDDGVRDLVSVHQTLVGQSAAAAILVNQSEPGGALTLGTQEPIAASRPILCPRGDVLGPQAEGVFIVDSGTGASLTESPRAIPYRAEVPPAPPCVGDLDGDSAVDGVDLGILLGAWGPVTGGAAADFNQDGAVDGIDLGVLLARWGACQA